ncbi:MAG: AAA family ATPase [Pirellulaceae bacterium]|nr:AAA family ATPase [Pirellulaceae bacterium]
MIIERLGLKAYGRFTDYSLDLSAAPNRFHIVYGLNESGKSTSLRAIKSLLYGMPTRAIDNYVHPNSKIRVSGTLVNANGDVLQCVRRRGRKNTLRDEADKEVIADSAMHQMLSGIDRETFEQRFGLSHDELVRGGADIISGGGDLGTILFAASAGVSKLREVQTQLDELCAKLFIPGGKNGSLNIIMSQFKQQKNELREAQVPPSEYEGKRERLRKKRDEVSKVDRQVKKFAGELSRLKALQKALPLIPRWESTQQRLDELSGTPSLDDAFTDRRRAAMTERELVVRKQADLKARLTQWRQQLDQYSEASEVTANQIEIENLFQKLGARQEAVEKRVELVRKRDELNRQMIDLLREFGVVVVAEGEREVTEAVDDAIEKMQVGDAVRKGIYELARQHERLIQQRDDASEKLGVIEHKIADLEQELEEMQVAGDPEMLNQLLDSIGHPSTLLESLAEQIAESDRCKRRCESERRNLHGTDATFMELARLRLPGASEIQQAIDAMEHAAKVVALWQSKQNDLSLQIREVSRRIKAEKVGQPLPTLADLDESRRARDELVSQIDKDDRITTDALRLAIHKADQIVDMIQLHHESVHQRSLDLGTLKSLQEEMTEVESVLATAQESSESAQQQWQALWQMIGVVADAPSRMVRWVADHEKLVEKVDQWQEQLSRVKEIEKRIDATCNRLRHAVESASFVPSHASDSGRSPNGGRKNSGVAKTKAVNGGTENVRAENGTTLFASEDSQIDLSTLYDEAMLVRRKLNDDLVKRRELESRLVELKQELPAEKSRLQSRQQQVDLWQQSWDSATATFTQTIGGTPTMVVEMFDQMKELSSLKSHRDNLAEEIRSITDTDASFRAKVNDVAARIGQDLSESPDDFAFVGQLYQELRDERAAASKRESIARQLAEAEESLEDAQSEQAQHEEMLKQLCADAGCADFTELVAIERLSRELREVQASFQGLDDQLRILAVDGDVKKLIAEAQSQDPGVLEVEISQLDSRQTELVDELNQCQREVGALQHELDRIDGGSRAADLGQAIQVTAGKLISDAEEYARLKIAAMILKRSIEHYRNENQDPVLEHAQRFFRSLTCGEYEGLRVDHDTDGKLTLIGVKSDANSVGVPATVMSTGAADSLYLSLRLASLQHHLSQGSPIPLIVDDCLVQLDDERAAAALSVFSELSTQTQVILFTHHRHLVDLASERLAPDQFHTHHLPC